MGQCVVGYLNEHKAKKQNSANDRLGPKFKTTMTKKGRGNKSSTTHEEDEQEVASRSRGEKLRATSNILECQYGLLTELNARGVLTDRQVADVHAQATSWKQNNKLITILMQAVAKDETLYDRFVTSLCETGQRHVAKQIAEKIHPNLTDRPLTRQERNSLENRSSYIIECLDLNLRLLRELRSASVLTQIHLSALTGNRPTERLKREFVDILKRRSFFQYSRLLRVLRKTGQEQIARVLETEGAVAALDVVLNQEMVNEVIEKFRQISLNEVRMRVLNQLLGMQGLEIVGLTAGHNVRIYFYCVTLQALKAFRQRFDSGHLKLTIERIVNSISCDPLQSSDIRLRNVYLVNYSKCEQYFNDFGETCTEKEHFSTAQTSKESLPYDLREQILLKSHFILYSSLRKKTLAPEQAIYSSLSAVCTTWRKIAIDRPWFAHTLRRLLRKLPGDVRLNQFCSLRTGRQRVRSIVEFDSRIVIAYGSETLRVYDAASLERLKDVPLEVEGAKAFDLASCLTTNSLYVCDYGHECIWRLASLNYAVTMSLWQNTGSRKEIYSMSVTSRGRVLLIYNYRPVIAVHSSDGTLVRVIRLPRDMSAPNRVLELQSGNYLLTHGRRDRPGLHAVCEITRAGRVVRTYGGPEGWNAGQLKSPGHIVVDCAGHVFVADRGNDRILVLDSLLNLCRVVRVGNKVGKGGADVDAYPYPLWYSPYSRTLMIVLVGGQLELYKIKAGRDKSVNNVGWCVIYPAGHQRTSKP